MDYFRSTEIFAAILVVLLTMALVYIFTSQRMRKPVGNILIDISEDGLTARVAFVIYGDHDISELVKRDYIVLNVVRNCDFDSLLEKQETQD